MSERKKVWGLYDYECKVWMKDNNSPPKRQRFFSGIEAYNAAEHHGANIQPRPFYIVSKSKLPDDVKELIAAAREWSDGDTENQYGSEPGKRFARAVRALDGKY